MLFFFLSRNNCVLQSFTYTPLISKFKKRNNYQPIISKQLILNWRILSIIHHSRRLKHFLYLKFILQLLISRVYQNMPSTFLLPTYRILSTIKIICNYIFVICKVVQKKKNFDPHFGNSQWSSHLTECVIPLVNSAT